MKKLRSLALPVAGCLLVASCQTFGARAPVAAPTPSAAPQAAPSAAPVQQGIDGRWIPEDEANRKIYYNEFRNGKFAAYTADGKNTLALGKYNRNGSQVTFEYFSQARGKKVVANCDLVGTARLQCAVEGSQIVLLRA